MSHDHLFAHRRYSPDEIVAMCDSFAAAEPFRHIVLDDFIIAPEADVLAAFPPPDWPCWTVFKDHYQFNKRFCGDLEKLPSLYQAMIQELSAPSFLTFLEEITGIKGLIPDPYLSGGGLHSSGAGGVLIPHADFHHYSRLELFRRINVLVYLNPGWTEADGGALELFRKGVSTPDKKVPPIYGRMVMFLTDNKSIHGFSEPVVGDDRQRNSIATYYYTSEETRSFSGDAATLWQSHGKASFARLAAYKLLLKASSLISRAAHAANPNLRRKPKRPE